ncbi:peptidoglycan-binding domain-containing protein [Luteimonas terrae]|uniref:Peptidoglycan-binding protein n=1 Tax=Luteimonas terrae TaxID=1530191 RepID=A0ABU1XX71_9GAMM|nr:peptidoglycan-binding domain-containing protein [Luteimonas terrae]MDR7193362.1 hypothetical protein [Luteimonas terrae]
MSIKQVQQMLVDAGFSPGAVDGLWGSATRNATPSPAPPVESPAALIDRTVLTPAFEALPERLDTPAARVILLAICGQEADFHHRWQVFDRTRPLAMGAARGLWQFERGGGVRGVLTHPASRTLAAEVCRRMAVAPTVDAVYSALHANDWLAACFARLLLLTNPHALPAVGDVEGAFQLYLREWRPGAWTNGNTAQRETLRRKWTGYYAQARAALGL